MPFPRAAGRGTPPRGASGCSWRVAATIPGSDFPPAITPAPGGRAYAWSENRTFLDRYDAGTDALTMEHNDRNDVNAIAFSRRDPSVMYFGLEKVE